MRPVWILLFLAVSSYSTKDSDIAGGNIEKGTANPGRIDCRSLGTELSRLSAQDDMMRELLAGEYLTLFLV